MANDDSRRPWGYFENLVDSSNHKVKRITVFPGKRLSLQSHARRAEHWFVVEGRALFTCNDAVMEIRNGQAVDHIVGAVPAPVLRQKVQPYVR